MKRILGIIAFVFLVGTSPALAVCPGTLQLKDNASVTANGKYVDDGSGNCQPSVIIGTNQGEAGTPATGVTQPTGGVGLSGWLSGIYAKLASALTVQGSAGATAVPTVQIGAANFAATQVSVASTATQIVAARTGAQGTGRKTVCVTQTGTTPVYLGGSGVTTSTGDYLAGTAGTGKCFDTQAAIYGIVASGTQTVSATETY